MLSSRNEKNVLVTGGAGFIGTHLCRQLVESGYRPRVLDLRSPVVATVGCEYARGDVRDDRILDEMIAGVEAVFHLAATVSVPLCQQDPADGYSNNFMATIKVLEAIRRDAASRSSPARLVFASSAALYGNKGDDGHALGEDETASEFSSFYAAQKHASEQAIALYRSTFEVPAVVFRFFNVFGPGQDPSSPYSGVITIFNKLACEKKPLPLHGGGGQTRDFVSVHDVVRACVSALGLPADRWDAKPMNLGSGASVTIRRLAEMIVKLSGGGAPLVETPSRDGDVRHSLAKINRAREALGFNPSRDLEAGLTELLKGRAI